MEAMVLNTVMEKNCVLAKLVQIKQKDMSLRTILKGSYLIQCLWAVKMYQLVYDSNNCYKKQSFNLTYSVNSWVWKYANFLLYSQILQMKSSTKSWTHYLTKIATHLVLPQANPAWLSVGLLLFQSLLTISKINSMFFPQLESSIDQFVEQQPSTLPNLNCLICLIICIAIQIAFRVSIIRLLYCSVLHNLLSSSKDGSIGPIVWVLLAVSFVLDVLKATENSFYSNIIWSEQYNHFKAVHFMFQIGILFTIYFYGYGWILTVAICVSSLGMLIVRRCLYTHSDWFSRLQQLQYFSYIVSSLLALWNYPPELPLTGSLILYLGADSQWKRQRKTYQELVQNGGLLKAIQGYLHYLSSARYDRQIESNIESFLHQAGVSTKSWLRNSTRNEYKKILTSLVDITKTQNYNFQSNLIQAQIEFVVNSNYFQSLILLRKMQCDAKCLCIFEKICILRLKEDIKEQILIRRGGMGQLQAHFQDNSSFISLLQLTSDYYRLWWECLIDQQSVQGHLELVSTNLLKSREQVRKAFALLNYKGIQTLSFYSYYLFHVERNVSKAIEIFRMTDFYFQLQLNIGLHNHVYLEISVEEASFGDIRNISSNAISLLQISSNILIGRNISNLIPCFFREHHSHLIESLISSADPSTLYNFQRTTILQDGEGNFHEILLKMAVNMKDEEGLVMSGFIRMPVVRNKFYVAYDQRTGEVLGGNKWLKIGDGKVDYIQELTKLDKTQTEQNVLEGKEILLYMRIEDESSIQRARFLKKLDYGKQRAIILQGKLPEKIKNKTLRPLTITSIACLSSFLVENNSSIWLFLSEKCNILKKFLRFSKAFVFLSILWSFLLVSFACLLAKQIMEQSNKAVKFEHAGYMTNVRVQQLGMLRLLVWAREIDFNHHSNTVLYDVNYSDFSDMKPRYLSLIKNIDEYSINDSNINQNVAGMLFETDNKVLMKEITSAMAYILDFKGSKEPTAQQIVFQQIDYLIYNWKAGGCAAPDQIREFLIEDYGEHDRAYISVFTHIYFVEEIFQLMLLGAICVLDKIRRNNNTLVLNHFSCLKEDDLKNLLKSISEFQYIVMGRPEKRRNIRTDHEISAFIRSKNSLMDSAFRSSNLELSCTTARAIQRVPYTENTQQTQYDQEIGMKKSRFVPLQSKPNYKTFMVMVFIYIFSTGISSVAFSRTQQKSFNLLDYIYNSFYLQKKIGSYGRVILAFYDVVDSRMEPESIDEFYKLVDKYNSDSKDVLNFDKNIASSPQFKEFDVLKKHIDFDPVCTYNACQMLSSELNVTAEDGLDKNIELMKSIITQKTPSPTILSSDSMQLLAYSLKIYFSIYSKLLDTYSSNLNMHILENHEMQEAFYFGVLAFYLLMTGVIVLPLTIYYLQDLRKSHHLLDIIEQSNYTKQTPLEEAPTQDHFRESLRETH